MVNMLSSGNFSFDFKTSSGDNISFEYLKESSLEAKSDKNSSHLEFKTLKSYEFNYEGNGIDERDKLEISEALEKITPMMMEFFKSENEKPLNQIAMEIEDIIPFSKDLNSSNFFKSKLIDSFDKLLNPIQFAKVEDAVVNNRDVPNIEQTFKSMQELLDEVLYLLEKGRPIYG